MSKNVDLKNLRWGTELVKRGFAKMQKGGVVMDVTNAEQAAIAEKAGAVAVMALERVPSDIRAQGGVARMSDPSVISEIIDAVTIPVMAKCRIGHFAEAQVLESLGVDMIDESEVLTPANPYSHVFKESLKVPFVCGATKLGEAVRRISEGAAMIRTKGEAGTGDVSEAVRHRFMMSRAVHIVRAMTKTELDQVARNFASRYAVLDTQVLEDLGSRRKAEASAMGIQPKDTLKRIRQTLVDIQKLGRLPVVDFTAGGIATPADAAMMMQLGSDGVFVGSGIFKSSNPAARAKAIVEAVTHFDEPAILAQVSKKLGEAMPGLTADTLKVQLAGRGV
jgi:pyridoxal 5'-phosphate synthase pdxS subunit